MTYLSDYACRQTISISVKHVELVALSRGIIRFLLNDIVLEFTGSQQTWDAGPTLIYLWPTVYDVGPTIKQRSANVSCLLALGMLLQCFCVARYSLIYSAIGHLSWSNKYSHRSNKYTTPRLLSVAVLLPLIFPTCQLNSVS